MPPARCAAITIVPADGYSYLSHIRWLSLPNWNPSIDLDPAPELQPCCWWEQGFSRPLR